MRHHAFAATHSFYAGAQAHREHIEHLRTIDRYIRYLFPQKRTHACITNMAFVVAVITLLAWVLCIMVLIDLKNATDTSHPHRVVYVFAAAAIGISWTIGLALIGACYAIEDYVEGVEEEVREDDRRHGRAVDPIM